MSMSMSISPTMFRISVVEGSAAPRRDCGVRRGLNTEVVIRGGQTAGQRRVSRSVPRSEFRLSVSLHASVFAPSERDEVEHGGARAPW